MTIDWTAFAWGTGITLMVKRFVFPQVVFFCEGFMQGYRGLDGTPDDQADSDDEDGQAA